MTKLDWALYIVGGGGEDCGNKVPFSSQWQAYHRHGLSLQALYQVSLLRSYSSSSPTILSERKHMEFSVGFTVLGAEHAQNYLKSFLGDLSFFPFIYSSTCALFSSV